MKNCLRFLFTAVFLYVFAGSALAQETRLPVVIINQIRGSEACCLAGDDGLRQKISENENLQKLPIAWALRWDVLQDEEIIKSYQELPPEQVGALLEVTPEFASASAVTYHGDLAGSDWHQARNAFLVGYTQEERKKLIDTYMTAFRKLFNTYPTFSVAWMIDSWSLNYLHDQYGVRVHELTKEQYETDSYTLYGGIFNLPYFASRSHPLLASTNSDNVMIMRQTVSDIDQNYGSYKAHFTSQPNDYLQSREKTDFSYFEQLLNTANNQGGNSKFALLGLENSLSMQEYQDEYMKQLNFVAEKQSQESYIVQTPIDYYSQQKENAAKLNKILVSPDFPKSGALYYFSEKYRARFENWDGNLTLTDFRIFTPQLLDPYRDTLLTVSKSYFVMPYLLDSSQQFSEITQNESVGEPVRRDSGVLRFGTNLGSAEGITIERDDNQVILKKGESPFVTLTQEHLQVKTSDQDIFFTSPVSMSVADLLIQNTPQYVLFERHPRFFFFPDKDKKTIAMGWESVNHEPIVMASFEFITDIWELTPRAVSEKDIEVLSSIFQPDRADLPMDPKLSVFYWNNKQAIAGRNPIRLYIDPRNSLNRQMTLSRFHTNVTNPDFSYTQPEHLENLLESFFVDITSNSRGIGTVRLTADGNILSESTQIRFFADCTKEIMICVQDWDELEGFTRIMVHEKWQEYQQEGKKFLDRLYRDVGYELDKIKNAYLSG